MAEAVEVFQSILHFPGSAQYETQHQPDFFPDLNLDQIIEAITASKEEYNLKPFFWAPLRDPELVRYRQEIMRDLEDKTLMACIKAFAGKMSTVRRYLALAEKLDFDYHKKGWMLEAALVYGDAVTALAHDLADASLKSRGLLAFRTWIQHYAQSQAFQSLVK